jgi:hypothetical protein
MKAHLLYRDKDFDMRLPDPWQAESLVKDLELTTLFHAMAKDDEFVFQVVRKVILAGSEKDIQCIRYRQEIMQDCLHHPAAVRELYALAVEVIEQAKKHYIGVLARYPDWVLRVSIEHMETFLVMIKKLRKLIDAHAGKFVAEGWTTFFARLDRELNDEFFAGVEYHLGQLKFPNGVTLSAELGKGNKGSRYLFHKTPEQIGEPWFACFFRWLKSLFCEPKPPPNSFSVHPRDESGCRALGEIRNQGIGQAANAIAQSTDHVSSFFSALRTELAFYIGCINLHEQLAAKRVPMCFASPMAIDEGRLSFQGLYDVCLALNIKKGAVVGNDANGDGKNLIVITGANQGGKSTLLRSIGSAQLMMQCGMFVPADSFSSNICDGLYTHFKREEDTGMKSGKLDEELGRMSDIIDHITPYCMILLNESFAATNEREGSEIGRQIISALVDERIKVICVTHLYELAQGFYAEHKANALFLRAERETSGNRTFKLIEGEPLPTSFGEDLYADIFGAEEDLPRTSRGLPQ